MAVKMGTSNRIGGDNMDLVTIMLNQQRNAYWLQRAYQDAKELWNVRGRYAQGTLGQRDAAGIDMAPAVEDGWEFNKSFEGTIETRMVAYLKAHFERNPGLGVKALPRRSIRFDKETDSLEIDIEGTLATCHVGHDSANYGPYQAALEAEAELNYNSEVLEAATEMLGYGKTHYAGMFDVQEAHVPFVPKDVEPGEQSGTLFED